jgi:hypothetical protein
MPKASLVFFYFGEDSYVKALAQETVKVSKAFENYDQKVLLKFDDPNLGPFDLNKKLEESVDLLLTPTKENLVAQINRLGSEGYDTDLFIFSHGFGPSFRTGKNEYGENTPVTAKYLRENIKTPNLRLVWQCNCYGSTLNPTWEALGAKASAGARYNNFFPTQFNGFIERWNAGKTLETSLKEANTFLSRAPVYAYIIADSIQRKDEWGNCKTLSTVLGTSPCAKAYFEKCWLGKDFQDDKSGKENLIWASEMIISGNKDLKK